MSVFNLTWHYARARNKPNNNIAFIAEHADALHDSNILHGRKYHELLK